MTILELPKDALLNLTDAQLEQLIGRLAEAEVASCGASVGDVRFSGSITAPDGGVDVRVAVQAEPFASGFIPRPNTIFQLKKHSMPARAITGEMRPKGVVAEAISQQCSAGGAYIIVSLADDCAEPMRTDRLNAMKQAVADDPNRAAIHLDFYDRFKLHQWLRQHPSVALWVRAVLGQPLSGWQAYGRWSNVPHGMTDDLIMAPGVSVVLPEQRHRKLTIEQAIVPTRQMITGSSKAIRIAGLSGVGKTRFVQALFDEAIGEAALDRTSVVYVDTGADPVPSARQMLDQLIQDGRRAIVVIDNCQPTLHSDLASRISSSDKNIKLITVEYDIRDDKPQTTEVIQIEADGPEIAEALVLRRYPGIGQTNAARVAQFSSGNTRVALALADRVEAGESLANLSDVHLFDRLFQQRHGEDGRLRQHAEALSLLYSFSVETADNEPDELAVLGSLCGATSDALFSSVQMLVDRQIAQKRGRWRAVLPHAIANKLASSALNKMRIPVMRATFEASVNNRALTSFAHRLGLMHDHPVAQQIVQAWLGDGGMLVPVVGLGDGQAQILDFIAPVCPDLLLDRIEAEIMSPDFVGLEIRNPRRMTILKMLVSLAYEPHAFERCVSLLMRIAQHEDPANNYDAVRDKIVRLFQPYLSGTHATPEQRAAIVRKAIWSGESSQRSLGIKMLSKTLDGPYWSGGDMGDFGARPRNFGYEPNRTQFTSWRQLFIGIALEAGLDGDLDLSERVRAILAQEFRGLWHHAAVRTSLTAAATRLNELRPWTDGWKAIQSTIYFDYRTKADGTAATPIPPELSDLRALLAPKDMVSTLKTYLFGRTHDLWSLDPSFDHDDVSKYEKAQARLTEVVTDLGEQFGQSGMSAGTLGFELFSTNWMPYGHAFGIGLARGAHDPSEKWADLVELLRKSGITNFNCTVLSGFVEEAGRRQQGLDRKILDECVTDPMLRSAIVLLHPRDNFDEADLDRCMKALEHVDVAAWSFGGLLWGSHYSKLPAAKTVELANMLLQKPNGDDALLDALGMRLHDTKASVDTLGLELRRLGLIAAISRIGRDRNGNATMVEHHMAAVIAPCLMNEGNDKEKLVWLDAIFSNVDAHYGYGSGYEEAIQVTAATVTEEFLDRVFSGDDRQRRARSHFLEQGGVDRSILATVDIPRVVEWCRSKSDPAVWSSLAMAIDIFVTSGDEKSTGLREKCIQFLEASPQPDLVMNAFASRITPNGWSGSRADIMEWNTNALAALMDHENPDIADAARLVVADARGWVLQERDRERREDEAQEQTFE